MRAGAVNPLNFFMHVYKDNGLYRNSKLANHCESDAKRFCQMSPFQWRKCLMHSSRRLQGRLATAYLGSHLGHYALIDLITSSAYLFAGGCTGGRGALEQA